MPCFILRSTSLHAMFRSMCLGFYAMLPFVSFLFLLYVDARVMCSHACRALLESMCLCALCHVLYLDPCSYMSICLDPCPIMSMVMPCLFLHVYMHVSRFPRACVLGSMLYMFHVIFHVLVRSMPCVCLD